MCLFIVAITFATVSTAQDRPVIIGVNVGSTGFGAPGGEAIRRGASLAISEINATGGVLGRQFALEVRDHRGNPDRGVDNVIELAELDGIVAIIGGQYTPVAMAEQAVIHEKKLVYLGPWAAGTPVIDNGHDPNFAFRVSVRDEFAGEFLIDQAFKRGFKRPGLLLWQTAWGRSNEIAITEALAKRNTTAAAVTWYNTGASSVADQIDTIRAAGADVILLVATVQGGIHTVNALAELDESERLPVLSHWGILGGSFFDETRDMLGKIDLSFLQSFSFYAPHDQKKADSFIDAYCMAYDDCSNPKAIPSPFAAAHSYDLVHLLALAIEKAGSDDPVRIRNALEHLPDYEGLVRSYQPAFTPERHDALDLTDFMLARFGPRGEIVPLPAE